MRAPNTQSAWKAFNAVADEALLEMRALARALIMIPVKLLQFLTFPLWYFVIKGPFLGERQTRTTIHENSARDLLARSRRVPR